MNCVGGFLMLVPDALVIEFQDFIKMYDDIIIFKPQHFSEVYKFIFDECSVAGVSVEADGRIGQG